MDTAVTTTLETLPDLRLADHTGESRTLSALVAGDPAIVHFYRGPWCPKEQRHFRRLVELQDELEVAYCRMVSISVDPPPVAFAYRAGLGARWTFLCDPDRTVQAELGLRETTDTLHDPYVPAIFVVRPDLSVARHYDGYWFLGRPTNDELLADLRAVTAELRPDWTAPAA